MNPEFKSDLFLSTRSGTFCLLPSKPHFLTSTRKKRKDQKASEKCSRRSITPGGGDDG